MGPFLRPVTDEVVERAIEALLILLLAVLS